ncbi:MAG: c-type cytochrome [Planctomycetia bacterium]|nr:c-type cytochrome [Planctomycetia bacterium]
MHKTFFCLAPQHLLRILAGLCIVTAIASAWAQDANPEKDALVVETLLRLETFDLDSKPKTKAAVLRHLKAHPASESFFQLIERFGIKDAGDVLLELAIATPGETVGVRAAELLLKQDDTNRIATVLAAEDSLRAAALIVALGNVGGKAVSDRLMSIVTAADKSLTVRSAAVTALGKLPHGETFLLECVQGKTVAVDLHFTLATVLFASADPAIKAAASKHLTLPVTATAKPLPPLADLQKMVGHTTHGKQLFDGTATCSKCHVVDGQGKDIGPNLSEIGSKLGKDALLVSILDPSAGISPSYETFIALTRDGKAITGVLVSKTDSELILKDTSAIVHTLKVEELEEMKSLSTSLMPDDLQKLLSAQDLVDVVEYLTTLKKQ